MLYIYEVIVDVQELFRYTYVCSRLTGENFVNCLVGNLLSKASTYIRHALSYGLKTYDTLAIS